MMLSEEVTISERTKTLVPQDIAPHALYTTQSNGPKNGKSIRINPNYKGKLSNYIFNFKYKGPPLS